jgi:hypothetical protein
MASAVMDVPASRAELRDVNDLIQNAMEAIEMGGQSIPQVHE